MTEPPLPLTRRGAYVWATAAAYRAVKAGDKAARNQAWNTGARFAAGLSLDDMLELNREARGLVDGVTVQPMTEEQARAAKRGTLALDNKGRTWVKAITLWHRYGRRETGDDGEKWPWHFVADHYGPMWPTSRIPQ